MLRIRNYLSVIAVLGALCLFAGCRQSGPASSGAPGTGASSGDQLSIVSTNGREIQTEFARVFKLKHPNVTINWLSQQGGTDNLRYVQARFASKKDGIGHDIFFGGGPDA